MEAGRANFDYLGGNLRKNRHLSRDGQNSNMTISGKTRGISTGGREIPRENAANAAREFLNSDAAAGSRRDLGVR